MGGELKDLPFLPDEAEEHKEEQRFVEVVGFPPAGGEKRVKSGQIDASEQDEAASSKRVHGTFLIPRYFIHAHLLFNVQS